MLCWADYCGCKAIHANLYKVATPRMKLYIHINQAFTLITFIKLANNFIHATFLSGRLPNGLR
jgi:hypothetical protein